jgi:ABC-type uncharacterized transport system substrate-binding protein
MTSIGCRNWPPIWSADGWTSSLHRTARQRHSRLKLRPRQFVFNSTGDPVKLGLVASYNRPGGNVTGVTSLLQELGAKRLGFLHELLPGAARFAVLVQESNPFKVHERVISDLRSAASTLGLQIEILSAVSNRDIDTAFATFRQKRAATRPGTCTAR